MDNSFESVDRLMEFGMSLAVAQQMTATVNQAIAGMYTAGAGIPIKKTEKEYFAVIDGLQIGPVTAKETEKLVKNGSITEDTLMWSHGMSKWSQARFIPEILKYIMLNKK